MMLLLGLGAVGCNTDKETEDTNDTQIAPEPDYGVPDGRHP